YVTKTCRRQRPRFTRLPLTKLPRRAAENQKGGGNECKRAVAQHTIHACPEGRTSAPSPAISRLAPVARGVDRQWRSACVQNVRRILLSARLHKTFEAVARKKRSQPG